MNMEINKLPILDEKNFDARYKLLIELVNKIQHDIVDLGLSYINKISGKLNDPKNENYFKLRESISFRLNSILFHLRLLNAVQKSQQKQMIGKPQDPSKIPQLHDEQLSLFDSIVFHSISLFDYLGNQIDYVCNTKGQMKLKWNGVFDSIKDSKNPLSQSPISKVVKDVHVNFVDKLYSYRSELIHYSNDFSGATLGFHPLKQNHSFLVFAPKKLCKRFSDLKTLTENNRVTLNFASFWLVEKTLKSIISIIKPMFEHIEIFRKITNGAEIFYTGEPAKK